MAMTGGAAEAQAGSSALREASDRAVLRALAVHRVLTAQLAAQATGQPDRGMRARLERLHSGGLVDRLRLRPASGGSGPYLWWLTKAGRRRIGDRQRPHNQELSPWFIEHTLAIAAAGIALQRLGPQVGIHVRRWQRDRAGWEVNPSLSGSRRITPDGRALVTVVDAQTGEEVGTALTLLLEMDRDTETLTRLATTFRNYFAYALHAEQPRPVLLVLTTTPERADRILATAAGEGAASGALLVGVSPGVDDPAPAVVDPVWRTEVRPEPHTLRELLLYRIRTEAADKAARVTATIEQARDDRSNRVMRLRAEQRPDDLTAALLDRSRVAVEAWAEAAPETADALLGWDPTTAMPPVLAAEAERLRERQRQVLLGAADAARVDDPRWRRAARLLTAGRLAPGWLIDAVAEPLDRAQAQARLLGDYTEQREQAVRVLLAARPRWRRTDAERVRLEQQYDAAQLRGCSGCGLLHRRRDPDRPRGCEHCGGTVVRLDELPAELEPASALLRRLAERGGTADLPNSYNASPHVEVEGRRS